jgi:hypothetical protein
MRRIFKDKDNASVVLSVRVSQKERTEMDSIIALLERGSGLAAGTVSPSAFMRSLLLKRIEETKKQRG